MVSSRTWELATIPAEDPATYAMIRQADRSFIRDISTTQTSIDIIRAMVALARALKMSVTAEGVETEQQATMLRKNGCTEAQGYLFSPPRPAAEIARLLLPDLEIEETAA